MAKRIYHYASTEYKDSYKLSSSEYVKKTHAGLHMTKTHGIGSGIYGLTTNTPQQNWVLKEELTITNPLVLDTDRKTADFILLARFMMETAEVHINQEGKDQAMAKNAQLPNFRAIANTLAPDLNITDAIKRFIADYRSADVGDFLRQPTNYLFEDSGYDGIYNSSQTGNSFALGSIKFTHIRPRHQKYAFEPETPGRMKGLLPAGKKYVGFFVEQSGGAPSKLKVGELRTMCNNYGMSCRDKDGKYLPRDKLIKLLQPFL